MIAAAGQPYHHGQRFVGLLARTPDINVQAVFVAPDVPLHKLRTYWSILTGVAYALAGNYRLRRFPAQLADRRLGIGNAFECKRVTFDDPAHGAALGADDVVGICLAAGPLREGTRGERDQNCDGEPKSLHDSSPGLLLPRSGSLGPRHLTKPLQGPALPIQPKPRYALGNDKNREAPL